MTESTKVFSIEELENDHLYLKVELTDAQLNIMTSKKLFKSIESLVEDLKSIESQIQENLIEKNTQAKDISLEISSMEKDLSGIKNLLQKHS